MKLSTRTRYGIRAALELAKAYGSKPVHLKTIAQCQGISEKYLEQLMSRLKNAGIVTSIRGQKGGYLLAKKPENIKLSQVFLCLEGPLITAECIKSSDYCQKACDCLTRDIWKEVEQAVMAVLESRSLKDVLDLDGKTSPVEYEI